MKYKAIIFDMDGTIIDTETIWFDATKKVVEQYGIEYTDTLHEMLVPQLHGLASRECCHIIKDILQLPDAVDDILNKKRVWAQHLYKHGVRFINGFHEFHNQVGRYNMRCAVATNADDDTVRITDESLNLTRYFGNHIYSISCVDYICKPDPAIYTYAAEQIAVKPHECIAIEDSAHGVKAAKEAGMYCIGINTARCRQRLALADHIVDSYDELSLVKLTNNQT